MHILNRITLLIAILGKILLGWTLETNGSSIGLLSVGTFAVAWHVLSEDLAWAAACFLESLGSVSATTKVIPGWNAVALDAAAATHGGGLQLLGDASHDPLAILTVEAAIIPCPTVAAQVAVSIHRQSSLLVHLHQLHDGLLKVSFHLGSLSKSERLLVNEHRLL